MGNALAGGPSRTRRHLPIPDNLRMAWCGEVGFIIPRGCASPGVKTGVRPQRPPTKSMNRFSPVSMDPPDLLESERLAWTASGGGGPIQSGAPSGSGSEDMRREKWRAVEYAVIRIVATEGTLDGQVAVNPSACSTRRT